MNPPIEVSIGSLVLHENYGLYPALPEDSETVRAIIASVIECGEVREALRVSKGRIIAGRTRWLAARKAGLETVPVIEVPAGDIHTVFQEQIVRRNFTKAQIAYVGNRLRKRTAEEALHRRVANLHRATAKREVPEDWRGDTDEANARRLGVSIREIKRSVEIEKLIARRPELRALADGKIWQEGEGLEGTLAALNGTAAGLDGKTHPRGDETQLMLALGSTALARFGREDKIPPADREEIKELWCGKVAAAMPDWLAADFEKALRARLRKTG